jgi:hypothetical protein
MNKLRSIPPANRRPTRLSSMRLSIHSGYTMVGNRELTAKPDATTFRPRVIRLDADAARLREIYRQAFAVLIARYNDLMAMAEPEEREFWKRELGKVEGKQ